MQYRKYIRTYHLPWSDSIHSDDKLINDLTPFKGKEIFVTEKMDGECTTMYRDYIHARSIDSKTNYTRSWATQMHSILKYEIPENMRLVVENLWAEHSIRYEDGELDGYCYLFSVWINKNNRDYCLSYDELIHYAELFDLPTPKVLYKGIYDENKLKSIAQELDKNKVEGYVMRTTEGFYSEDSESHIAKYVREGHVQPNSEHWLKNAKQNGKLKNKVKPYYMA